MGYDPYKSNAEKKGKGNRFFTFNWGDKKVEFFKIKEAGDYRFDIIPHKIATKHHPAIKDGASVGDEVYCLDYWVHRNVGPRQVAVVCPSETLAKPCPICELAEKMKREHGPKSAEFTALLPKHRAVYNIVDPDDENEKIKIFEESFALFEQELIKYSAARGRKKGKDYIHFAELSEGWTVEFAAEENTFNGSKFFKYNSWSFEERDKPHNKSIISSAYALDEYLTVKSYDELTALLYGNDETEDEDDEAEEEEKPAKKAPKEEDEDASKVKCPAGKKYGKDYDRKDDKCDDCESWAECRKLTKEGA